MGLDDGLDGGKVGEGRRGDDAQVSGLKNWVGIV